MKKILLTGSTGFIGRNLHEQLNKEKYALACPQREELDLLDGNAVESYLRAGQFDIVIHAANTNNSKNPNVAPYEALDGNLRMFFHLERCRSSYGKMFYFGSGAEYDMTHYIPDMTEDYFDTYVPKDPYGLSKYVMSKACQEGGNIYDLRLFGVYGRHEEWHRRFISNAICRAMKGMPITISQNVYFDYIWVGDLAKMMEWFLDHEPKYRHYNVCRGSKIDLFTLACKVRKILNIDCEILVEKTGFKSEYTGCNGRLMEEMGFFEFTGWEDSIRKLSAFYQENIEMVDEAKLI